VPGRSRAASPQDAQARHEVGPPPPSTVCSSQDAAGRGSAGRRRARPVSRDTRGTLARVRLRAETALSGLTAGYVWCSPRACRARTSPDAPASAAPTCRQSRTSRATGSRSSSTSAARPATSETTRSPVSRSRQAPVGSCSAVSPQPRPPPGRPAAGSPRSPPRPGRRRPRVGGRPGHLDRLVPGEPLGVVAAGPQGAGDHQQLGRAGLVDRRAPRPRRARPAASRRRS
jgi:hypothetical protein